MSWGDKCLMALAEKKLFESSGHRTRFKELMDCYSDYPFFSKGLCKCMYLSAWDEEHFCVMLETLTDMSLGRETDTGDMRMEGDIRAGEQMDDEYYMYHLANAFLDGVPFQLAPDANVSPEKRYTIRQALRAAEVIDNL